MSDLSGKVALVTGAGGEHGIGRAIARQLAADGADVAVNDVTSAGHGDWGGLSAVAEEIKAMGRASAAIVADVADSAQVTSMVSKVLDQFGHIEILINNAGAPAGPDRVPVVELEEEVWDRVQDVNVKGTFLCSRAVARQLIQQGRGGHIINISSIAGKIGVPRYAAYCSSKFALVGFTQCLALELAAHGINVNAICPALTDTERVLGIADGLKPSGVSAEVFREQLIAAANENNPLGRLATPSDVAAAAAFLVSDGASYLTGIALNVAGGAVNH